MNYEDKAGINLKFHLLFFFFYYQYLLLINSLLTTFKHKISQSKEKMGNYTLLKHLFSLFRWGNFISVIELASSEWLCLGHEQPRHLHDKIFGRFDQTFNTNKKNMKIVQLILSRSFSFKSLTFWRSRPGEARDLRDLRTVL